MTPPATATWLTAEELDRAERDARYSTDAIVLHGLARQTLLRAIAEIRSRRDASAAAPRPLPSVPVTLGGAGRACQSVGVARRSATGGTLCGSATDLLVADHLPGSRASPEPSGGAPPGRDRRSSSRLPCP